MPDDERGPAAYHPKKPLAARAVARTRPEVMMCNFELSPEAFRQRRIEMVALADERRLAQAMKPVRVRQERARRKLRAAGLVGPVRLNPSPVAR
jgi:hypothetical protein